MRRYWLLCVALLAGCVSSPRVDARRPLVGCKVPTLGEIRPLISGYSDKTLSDSLGDAAYAQNVFGLMRAEDWYSYPFFSQLNDAVGLVRENPFAWINLGAYLAVNHETEAAILATQRGLGSIEEICRNKSCPPVLGCFRDHAAINLAMYLADVERPLDALDSLESVRVPDLRRFEQLAWHWTAANVKSTLGDIDGARQSLSDAAAITDDELRNEPDLLYAYPQYFGDRRKAIEFYLMALIDVAEDETARAEENLKAALALYAESWDALLLLSSLQHRRGDYDAAITTLSRPPSNPKSIFRPERLDYNLGSAYLARFESLKNRLDLQKARDALRAATDRVEDRFERRHSKDTVERKFDNPIAGQFYLEALSKTPPIYADACNNLGSVYAHFAELETGEKAQKAQLDAEEQWLRALRDAGWPRRHLAYGNLARAYASVGRLDAAAEAADAALAADPFNVVPLRALLDWSRQKPMPKNAVEAVEIAARLIGERRRHYSVGTFDTFLAPYESHLRTLQPAADVRKALFLIRYALAADDTVDAILQEASQAIPEWSWPAIAIARKELATGGELSRAQDVVAAVEREVALHDWLAKREQGEFFLLRAEVRERETYEKHYREARRDIERAMASGIGTSAVEKLRERVDGVLQNSGEPTVSSLAVLPFETISAGDAEPMGHALGWSLSSLLRLARGPAVRSLERDALGLADWSPESAVEAGRRSGIGAVVAGRYARGNQFLHIDISVFDSVSGESILTRAYSVKPTALRETQITIANDVLMALRLPPTQPVRVIADEVFSSDSRVHQAYLAGIDILLSGPRDDGLRGLERAETLFRTAMRDPAFGRARAGLAFVIYEIANRHRAAREVIQTAERAAADAIRLAPDSPEALLATALVETWFKWDFEKGRMAFEAAERRDPYSSTIHRRYSDYLIARGRDLGKAMDQARLALSSAPGSLAATLQIGKVFFYRQEYDEALAQADAALTLKPDSPSPYELKSWIYTQLKRYSDALDTIHAAARRSPHQRETPEQLSHKGVIYALNGDPSRAQTVLNQLTDMAVEPDGPYVLPLLEARVLLAKGDRQAALSKLREALDHRSESMAWLEADPWFRSLENDRGFEAILAQIRPK